MHRDFINMHHNLSEYKAINSANICSYTQAHCIHVSIHKDSKCKFVIDLESANCKRKTNL